VHSFSGRNWYQQWGTIKVGSELMIVPHVVSIGSAFGGQIFSPNAALNGLAFNPDGSTYKVTGGTMAQGAVGTPGAHATTDGGSNGTDLAGQIETIYPDVKHNNEFAYFDYELTNDLTAYVQYLRGEESTFRYNTPGGSMQGTPTAVTIFSGNAFLPAAIQTIMTANNIASFTLRRTGGPLDFQRQFSLSDNSVMNSGTGGFDWNISNDGFFNGWRVSGDYQYGYNVRHGYQVGLRVDRLFAAVDAVKDGSGNIVCRTSTFNNQFPGCVPINLFGEGNASAAAVDYLTGNDPGVHVSTPLYFADGGYGPGQNYSYTSQEAKVITTTMHQQVAELSADGKLFEGWAGPITAAFGGTWRKEEIRQVVQDTTNPPDDNDHGHPVLCNGDAKAIAAGLRGVNPPDCANTVGIQYSKVSNILGEIDVKEAFGETEVPLLRDLPFMQSLKSNLAARWADYSGSGTIWAYKGGLDADIVDGLRLRGTLSRDVRAANLSERFDKTGGSAVVTDPRYPADGSVTVTIFSGGNPNVMPEKANTITGGFVLQPQFLDGFSLSADYYRIKIKDAIGQIGAQGVVNQCEAGAAQLCALITRDPTTDKLVLVGNLYVNIAEAIVRGVDLEASYHRDIDVFGGDDEAINARVFSSWLLQNSTQNTGAKAIDRAGQTGIQQSDGIAYSLPKFKATGNVTYSNGGLSVFVQGRYIGSGKIENALAAGAISSNHVDSAFYLDGRIGYRLDAFGDGNMEVFIDGTNLLNQDPPVTPYFSAFLGYAQQTNPSLFDVLGRRFVVGVKFAN
jgi:outer membrane receptor protein involved in Fe transport